jgi:hypothetical protein
MIFEKFVLGFSGLLLKLFAFVIELNEHRMLTLKLNETEVAEDLI